ncbi:MAG: hemolysin family protein [Defluviitaleaceae bacterium]|nr:hemolysin family protein [Defluviitaleaceae bacterium]
MDSGSTGSVADIANPAMHPGLLAAALALIVLSSFFSMSETSLVSLSALKVRSMIESGKRSALLVDKLLKDREKLISSILIGSNFSAIAFTSIATAVALGMTDEGNEGLVMAVTTVISTIIIVVVTDITPKTIASKYSEKIACFVARPLSFVLRILSPVSAVLNFFINRALLLFGFSNKADEVTITETELKTMLNVSREEGVIEEEEGVLIDNVFEFTESVARDSMIPRTDIVGISVDASYDEVMELFSSEKYSRLPVYREDTDHIIGVLNFKDFIFSRSAEGDFENAFEIEKYMRPPLYSYETQPMKKLFAQMRKGGLNLAVVLDEYGGTAGILTIEDLIEEIVGDIFDEHDQIEEEMKYSVEKKEYIAPGGTKIDDFNKTFNTNLFSEDYETLAGYVLGLFGYIPKQGEKIFDSETKMEFIVEAVEKNRIEELKVIFK